MKKPIFVIITSIILILIVTIIIVMHKKRAKSTYLKGTPPKIEPFSKVPVQPWYEPKVLFNSYTTPPFLITLMDKSLAGAIKYMLEKPILITIEGICDKPSPLNDIDMCYYEVWSHNTIGLHNNAKLKNFYGLETLRVDSITDVQVGRIFQYTNQRLEIQFSLHLTMDVNSDGGPGGFNIYVSATVGNTAHDLHVYPSNKPILTVPVRVEIDCVTKLLTEFEIYTDLSMNYLHWHGTHMDLWINQYASKPINKNIPKVLKPLRNLFQEQIQKYMNIPMDITKQIPGFVCPQIGVPTIEANFSSTPTLPQNADCEIGQFKLDNPDNIEHIAAQYCYSTLGCNSYSIDGSTFTTFGVKDSLTEQCINSEPTGPNQTGKFYSIINSGRNTIKPSLYDSAHGFNGTPYLVTPLPAEDCKTKCVQDPKCRGYTLEPITTSTKYQKCSLYDTAELSNTGFGVGYYNPDYKPQSKSGMFVFQNMGSTDFLTVSLTADSADSAVTTEKIYFGGGAKVQIFKWSAEANALILVPMFIDLPQTELCLSVDKNGHILVSAVKDLTDDTRIILTDRYMLYNSKLGIISISQNNTGTLSQIAESARNINSLALYWKPLAPESLNPTPGLSIGVAARIIMNSAKTKWISTDTVGNLVWSNKPGDQCAMRIYQKNPVYVECLCFCISKTTPMILFVDSDKTLKVSNNSSTNSQFAIIQLSFDGSTIGLWSVSQKAFVNITSSGLSATGKTPSPLFLEHE